MNNKNTTSQWHTYEIAKKILLLSLFFLPLAELNAQNVRNDMSKAFTLMGEKKYSEAYNILQIYNDTQAAEYSDTCAAYYNYYKGSCLYYLKKYEEAIPVLQKGIQMMDKIHYRNCDYLEMIYGIGLCYKKLGNYNKTEEYFRRSILKGTNFNNDCAIRNKTYSEMAELYSSMGKPDLADICTSRIESEMRLDNSKNLDAQLEALWDLYEAHQKMEKFGECINDLKKIRYIIEEKDGIVNKNYLQYSSLLGSYLRYKCNRPHEAAVIHKEMIEIGTQLKTYCSEVCQAYLDYLCYLSENNKVDSLEMILPYAIKYYNETEDLRDYEENLYEIVGNGLCDAQNYEEGIKYLQKKWKGENAKSIKALYYLGSYFFYKQNSPEKALPYYKDAEARINEGLDVNDITKITILEDLVEINERLGNRQESNRYSKIIEPLFLNLGDNHIYLRYLINWSTECAYSGNKEKCQELVSKMNTLIEKISIDDQISALSQMAFVCIKTDNIKEAVDYASKGIGLSVKEKGEECLELVNLYHNLGRALMLKGNYVEALSALNKSKDLQIKLNGEVMQRTLDYIKECEGK